MAEISALDVAVKNGKVKSYRAKVKLSFKDKRGGQHGRGRDRHHPPQRPRLRR